MKSLRYFVLVYLLYMVAFHNAAAQVVASLPENTNFQKQVSDTLYVYFKVGKTDIIPSYMGNSATLSIFDRFLTGYTTPSFRYTIQGITLQGSASPDGKASWNRILATRRSNAIIRYIRNEHTLKQELVKENDITINQGANYTKWPKLRSTRIIVDYSKVSNDELLPQTEQMKRMSQAIVTKAEAKPVQLEKIALQETALEQGLENKKQTQKGGKNFCIALKTNALYDLLLTPNIGVEIPVTDKWSVAANWMYAWWKADPSSWYHRIYGGDIEVRRYIKKWPWSKKSADRTAYIPLTGWHVGVYGQMLTYDFEWGGTGYLGDKWSYAAGVALGYSKNIARNLNIDFTLGVGYLTGEYKVYKPIDNCYVWQATKQRHWFGPTKAEVSLVWLLGKW